MSREEFLQAMAYMGAAYGKRIPQEQVEVWYTFFHDENIGVFRQAVSRTICKSRYLPSVAEIRAEIALVKYPMLSLNAVEEWDAVQQAVRRYGYYNAQQATESLNPFTAKIVKMMGGISAICQSDSGEWLRKEFIRLFNELYETQSTRLALSENQLTKAEIKSITEQKLIEAD